jgi:dTMP kinase
MSIDKINRHHIAIEGIDGCGKSTFIKKLSEMKLINDYNTLYDCSPYDSEVTKVIRKMLKNEYKLSDKVLHKELLSLFMLDNHIHGNEITKFLSDDIKNLVITDRYISSTFAYQSLNAKLKDIVKMTKDYDGITCPGLILYFDISPELSLNRVNSRGEEKEIFEKTEVLEQVKNNYYTAFNTLDSLTKKKVCIISIDASLPKDDVFNIAFKVINEYLTFGSAYVQSTYSKIYNKDSEKNKYCKCINY